MADTKQRTREALASLKKVATKATRDGMARYGLPNDKALGVPMNAIQKIAKGLGRDHALALALWDTGVYEARLLAAYVGEPEKVTAAQMDRWCRTFDNWGTCDTVCFTLFDRTPLGWKAIPKWAAKKGEFQKRAAFALLACMALHKRETSDAQILKLLPLIEKASTDERNFVKKSVNWALRAIGGKKSPVLRKAARELAQRLSESEDPTARWIGKDALRQLKKRGA